MNNTNKIILSLVIVGVMGATYYFYAPSRVGVGGNAIGSVYEQQLATLRDAPITKAQKEIPLTEKGVEKLKIFDVTITQSSMTPDAIVAEKGDVVQLNIRSDRDLKIESKDMRFSAPMKENVPLSVSILPMDVGTYTFYAQDGSGTVFGHMVVRPRG